MLATILAGRGGPFRNYVSGFKGLEDKGRVGKVGERHYKFVDTGRDDRLAVNRRNRAARPKCRENHKTVGGAKTSRMHVQG
jgi:hypothetical protein